MNGLVRCCRAVAVATVLAGIAIIVTAAPASAHGVGGVQPRNYETKLLRVDPAIPGIHLTVVDLGDNLILRNDTRHDVVVLGYDGEPYLRVGPRGVFENMRSPATYLNRSRIPTSKPPRFANPTASPVWHKVSSAPEAKWHDHRAHFMGTEDPPEVTRDTSSRHLIDRWNVEFRTNGKTVRASGELLYVPPPSPWPFVGIAIVLAGAVVLLSRTRIWRATIGTALTLLVASDIAHVIGVWDATTASTGSKFAESAYSLAGIGLGLLALAWMWRRGAEAAMPLVLVAGIFLFFAGGLADVGVLGHSEIPTTLPDTLERLLVAFDLGLGAGVAIGAALHLRQGVRATAPARRSGTNAPRRAHPTSLDRSDAESPVTS